MDAPVRDTLRAVGLRRTPARERILAAVRALAVPVTHGELTAYVEEAELDAVTVYRTLGTLVEVGILHRIHGLDGAWRYCVHPEGRGGCPANHPHFHCVICHGMTCLVDQPMPKVAVPAGAAVEGRQLVVWGRCPACAIHSPAGNE